MGVLSAIVKVTIVLYLLISFGPMIMRALGFLIRSFFGVF
jgi:hypothetical protein